MLTKEVPLKEEVTHDSSTEVLQQKIVFRYIS